MTGLPAGPSRVTGAGSFDRNRTFRDVMEIFWLISQKMFDGWSGPLYSLEASSDAQQIKSESGGLAQLGERLSYKQRVSGSSPLTSTIFLER